MSTKTTNNLRTFGDKTIQGSLEIVGDAKIDGNFTPKEECVGNLGTNELKWNSVHAKGLNLSNDRGDWTVIPEENYLSVRDNKTNKLYKLVLEEIG